MDEKVAATGRSRIDELNQGLTVLQRELLADATAAQRVQLAIVRVGGLKDDADLLMDWTDASAFQPPRLEALGRTPLAKGMRLALQTVASHKQTLQRNGVGYTRPWIMIISDGVPTDEIEDWLAVAQECRAAEASRHCVIFPIGVADANLPALQQLSSTPALQLSEARFKECFQWLSSSLQSVSRSRPGEQVQLGATNPWSTVG
jgi:uncharacterized protein YegL